MNDLFEREQRIIDESTAYLDGLNGAQCDPVEFKALISEYGKLLRHLRRVTKISDRTTIDLNASKLDLLDKVHYDPLTGIYNRRFMEENLLRIIKTASRFDGILGVLMIDVDYFKKYNDTYGHSMGDECLKSITKALHKIIQRPDDFVARYGGEEFIAVLPNTDENGLHLMAERMLDSVRALGIPHERSEAADCITVSIGGTMGSVQHTQSNVDYIKQADKALYMSKQNGRNKYTFLTLGEGT